MAALRDGVWLTQQRVRAYAAMLVAAMALGLVWGDAGVVLGHNPGTPATHSGLSGPTDFLSFWSAGRLALRGEASAAYQEVPLTQLEQATAVMQKGSWLAFFYPPPFLLFCALFAALPYVPAFFAFVAAQSAAMLLPIRRLLPRKWGLLGLFSYPGLLLNAATGQSAFWCAGSFGAAALWLERRPLCGGAALGLLVIKPHFALTVPVALLAARRWRALAGFAASAGWLILLSVLCFGIDAWSGFFHAAPVARIALESHAEDWRRLQSVFTAVRLAGGGLSVAYAAQTLIALGAVAALALIAWRRPGAGAEASAMAACALLFPPHVLDYDLASMAVPLAWLAGEAEQRGWLPWEKTGAAAIFVWPLIARAATVRGFAVGPVVLGGLMFLVWRRSCVGAKWT